MTQDTKSSRESEVKPIKTVRPILLKQSSAMVSPRIKALSRKSLFNSPSVEIKSDFEKSPIPSSQSNLKLPGRISLASSEIPKAIGLNEIKFDGPN